MSTNDPSPRPPGVTIFSAEHYQQMAAEARARVTFLDARVASLEAELARARTQLEEIAQAAGYPSSILAAPCNALAHNIKMGLENGTRAWNEIAKAQGRLTEAREALRPFTRGQVERHGGFALVEVTDEALRRAKEVLDHD